MKTLAVNATWQKQSLQGAILFRAKLSGSKILAARIRLVIITSRSTKQRNTKRSLKILLIVLKETKNNIYFTSLNYLCKRVTKLSPIPTNPAKPVMAVSTPEIAKCHKDKSSSSGLPQEDIMRSVINQILSDEYNFETKLRIPRHGHGSGIFPIKKYTILQYQPA